MVKESRKFNRLESNKAHMYNPYGYGQNFDISTEYDGYVKCKLIHKEGASFILPELIIIGDVTFPFIELGINVHYSFS